MSGNNTCVAESDELNMLRDYILLPHLLTIVDNNRKEIEGSSITLKPLYLGGAQAIMDMISADIRRLKKELFERGIKLTGPSEYRGTVYYHPYVCRGYEDLLGIVREVMKAQLGVMLGDYIGKLITRLKEAHHAVV